MARWAADHEVELRAADPDTGDLQNRVADNWRPLFAIADVAEGAFPGSVRKAAAAAVATRTEQSARAQLLADIKAAFDSKGTDRLSSEQMTEHLVGLDDRPWAEWRAGKPISKSGLARQLTPFGISQPETIRVASDRTAKGYYRSAFEDAFERYLPFKNVTTSQAHSRSDCDGFQSVTPPTPVTPRKPSRAYSRSDCDVVTFLNPGEDKLAREDDF